MPTYRFTIQFEAFENEHPDLTIEKYFKFLMGGFGYKITKFEKEMVADEGGTDENLPCKKCGLCEKPLSQMFSDGRCICGECRSKEGDPERVKEWDRYLELLKSKGLRYDDVKGEVPIN